ncbi:MAG: hypothetical protein Q9227_009327 [Pyrenula ochraceoflavens]
MDSSFLTPSRHSEQNGLAVLHLRRDLSIPTIISSEDVSAAEKGYAEGVVTNTRFGAFPHSTLAGIPWGSQVRASKVDTGSRGRKRKVEEASLSSNASTPSDKPADLKQAVTATSGFAHLLPPTPENWTTSLPHRTQVVYTPDYSYILHRIRARPGSVLIEAGSGSGSFTHAAARSVFGGCKAGKAYSLIGPDASDHVDSSSSNQSPCGRVYSYEFHSERFAKVQQEMKQHNLDSIVTCIHRDVYSQGFLIQSPAEEVPPLLPRANAIFLDLPAPWQALPHLTRHKTAQGSSALDPDSPVHICTFSPCIEQAQRTVSSLRRHGWLHIDMVELNQKRLEVRRDHTGLEYEGIRSTNAVAVDVDQAVTRLREVEKKAREYYKAQKAEDEPSGNDVTMTEDVGKDSKRQLWKEGRLVHRTESELKTHTSYLVFAVLPQEWTEDDELRAREEWANPKNITSSNKSRRQAKRDFKQKAEQDEDRGDRAEALNSAA